MLRILLVSAIGVLPAARAWAVDVTPSGFLVRHELAIGAPAARVYASLLDVGSWWSGKHTYSGESRNLSIDARAGGCFCEKLPNGAVEHMRVVFLRPNEVLRMGGALGPLQANGTKVDLTYSVGGFMAGGFEAIAPGAPAAK